MKEQLEKLILKVARKSNNALLKKIERSLERDKRIPLSHLIKKALIFFRSLLVGRFYLRKCDKVGRHARTRCKPHIENAGRIELGDEININSRNVQTDLVSGPDGLLKIGDSVSINFGVSIVANKKVQLGNNIRVGPYTMIYDSDVHVHGSRFTRASGKSVIIEDDVWLASRTMILKGSLIGKGSIIAAGSVVSGVIPPYVVAAGAPAKVIRYLKPPEGSNFKWEREDESEISSLVIERVKKIASEVMGISNEIQLSWTHDDIEQWDSIMHVNFVKALEKEFKISIKPKDNRRMMNMRKACEVVDDYLYTSVESV